MKFQISRIFSFVKTLLLALSNSKMGKIVYPHNNLRKQLSEEEKKRFNAYKKRECERRRRYAITNRMSHKNFYLHRCEFCRKFFEVINLLYGFSICINCPKQISKVKMFLHIKAKRDDLAMSVSEGNIQSLLLTSDLLQSSQDQTQCHETQTEDIQSLLESFEIESFLHDLYIIQLNEDFDAQYGHSIHPHLPSLPEFENEGIERLFQNFHF